MSCPADKRTEHGSTLEFVRRKVEPHLQRREDAGEIARSLRPAASQTGLLGLGFSEGVGGQGGTLLDSGAMQRAFSGAGGSSGLTAGLFTVGIALPHHERISLAVHAYGTSARSPARSPALTPALTPARSPALTAAYCRARGTFGRVVDHAGQLPGGTGYRHGTEVERHYRDARIVDIGGGATDVPAHLAARLLGHAA